MPSRSVIQPAQEYARFDILDSNNNLIATFNESDRSGGSGWTDLNLNDWQWSWQDGGASEILLNISDPSRFLYDTLKRSYKVRGWFDGPADGLQLSWDMQTLLSPTLMADLSGKSNDGTITGTTDVLGFLGRSRGFPGASGNDINKTPAPASSLNMSVAGWFNWTTNPTPFYSGIHGGSNSYELRVDAAGTLSCVFYQQIAPDILSSSTSGLTYNDGKWHLAIAVLDSGVAKLYVDGTLVGTPGPAITSVRASTTFQVGFVASPFNGTIGGAMVWSKALTPTQISEFYKSGGIPPKQYFEARIYDLSYKNNITVVRALDSINDLLEYEVYDLIYEGTETTETVPPAYVIKKNQEFHKSDTHHNKQHIFFKNVSNGASGIPAAGGVYQPLKIEVPENAEYRSSDNSYWKLGTFNADTSDIGVAVSLQDTTIKSFSFLIDFQGNTNAPPNTNNNLLIWDNTGLQYGIYQIPFDNDGSTGFKWVTIDTSAVWKNLSPDTQWMVGVQSGTWTVPIRWKRNPEIKRDCHFGATSSTRISSPLFVAVTENSYNELPQDKYIITTGSGNTNWIADLEVPGTDIPLLPDGPLNGLFRCTYFYSEGIKKVSDVINRILNKVGFSSIFTGSGGSSSTLNTKNLGLYMPQGGSIKEHLDQLIAQTEDSYYYFSSNKLQFRSLPQPSVLINPSFEHIDKNGASVGWTLDPNADISTATPFTGNKHARMQFSGGSPNLVRIYQDVEAFDTRASYLDGNNAEVWTYRNSSTIVGGEFFEFRVKLYDYGTFLNPVTVLTMTPTSGQPLQWIQWKYKINRPSFRYSIEVERFSGTLSSLVEYIDDALLHGESFYSLVIRDPAYSDSIYTSGLVPLTQGTAPKNTMFIEDISGPPDFSEQTSARLVNSAVSLGNRQSVISQFGETFNPIVAMAKNIASVNSYGLRNIIETGNYADIQTAYNAAKSRLLKEQKYRLVTNLVGQYAFLTKTPFSVFFPNQGIRDPLPARLSTLTMTPSSTELEFNRSIIEQFVDLAKYQERQKFLEGAYAAQITDSLLYFTGMNLPSGLALSTIYQAKLKTKSGLYTPAKPLVILDYRDTNVPSVFYLKVSPTDGTAWTTTTSDIYTAIRIETSANVLVTEQNLPESFAMLPNLVFFCFLFAP
jgi:Concanavalin A-like lectin/glucanases superfamily